MGSSQEPTDNLSVKREQLIASKLAPQLAQIFGYHALLYSPKADELSQNKLLIKHKVVIGNTDDGLDVKCRFEELPFAADCIDLALLPNILQNSENPHQILREVERVLIPEGVAIIIGRNPFSWPGLLTHYKRWRNYPEAKQRDISRRRLNDWFNLLGFEMDQAINISATNHRIQNGKFYNWLKSLANLFCNCFCSYYVIIAKKKVSTLTPIRQSWRKNKQLVPSRIAEPSVRNQVENWFEQLFKESK